jgi:hypothetical protein
MPTAETPPYEHFLSTYSGKELLKKHSLEETGIWHVWGEDPNCDLGGAHVSPFLGTFEGRLADVLTEVTKLGGFWTWGSGGRLEKTSLQQVPLLVKPVIRKSPTNPSPASMIPLFDLIESKTKEGKIKWDGTEYSSKLEGTVPGTGMSLEITHFTGDQREPADDYSLQVRVGGNTVNVGTSFDVKKLFKWIVENPARLAESDAREILEKL